MSKHPLIPVLLLLGGCATAYVATTAVLVPTLHVTNLTDDHVNVTIEGRTILRVGGLREACAELTALPLSESVVLAFRRLGGHPVHTMPVDFAGEDGWALTFSNASADGGFFPYPAPRCR